MSIKLGREAYPHVSWRIFVLASWVLGRHLFITVTACSWILWSGASVRLLTGSSDLMSAEDPYIRYPFLLPTKLEHWNLPVLSYSLARNSCIRWALHHCRSCKMASKTHCSLCRFFTVIAESNTGDVCLRLINVRRQWIHKSVCLRGRKYIKELKFSGMPNLNTGAAQALKIIGGSKYCNGLHSTDSGATSDDVEFQSVLTWAMHAVTAQQFITSINHGGAFPCKTFIVFLNYPRSGLIGIRNIYFGIRESQTSALVSTHFQHIYRSLSLFRLPGCSREEA